MRVRAAAVAAALAALIWVPAGASGGVPGFDRERLEIHDFHLFDLGVADHDDDDDLDLFTINHLSRQSLLSNDGSGAFTERLYEAGLGQTRALPGWEDQEGPQVTGPGLYLSHDSGLVLRHVGGPTARGSVEFLFRPTVNTTGRARVDLRKRRGPGHDPFVAEFKLSGNSRVALGPPNSAHPWIVRVQKPYPLGQVVVGALERTPPQRQFTLYRRDRHGMAWADVAGGAGTDVFIVRGGLRGRINQVKGRIEDELLAGAGGEFKPAGSASSLRKGTCRGRMAGAADLDGDGRLDLYETCKGNDSPKLYRQRAGGGFSRASRGLARAGLDTFVIRVADLDGDLPLEILAVTDRGLEVYDRAGGWHKVQSVDGRQAAALDTQLALGDPDRDGDQDAYVAAETGSTLLRNRGGRMRPADPGDVGLPRSALAAAWADYDNDGRLDLHAVPGGLYRQEAGFEFSRVGSFTATNQPPAEARLAWPDLDGDGFREPVIASRLPRSDRRWKTFAFPSAGGANHWLEVGLEGKAANRQAIGARVRVRAAGSAQTQWVGSNETSLYSQGHYRLYFGLGDQDSARVEVRWPRGRVRDLGTVAADQILELSE